MTTPSLTLTGVSHVLPDGRQLFPPLDLHLDQVPTGLVGGNGVGKSVLGRVLAGVQPPSSGRRDGSGTVHYLPQQVAVSGGTTVADLAGLRGVLDALARIEAGGIGARDYELVGERWQVREQLAAALAREDLAGLDPGRAASTLSGGEAMRVALAGAWLSGADMLVLDEPSNHLDGSQRQRLMARLREWRAGLLVISHDRALLGGMQRIIELSADGLRSYGGGYAFYAQARAAERAAAWEQLERCRLEARRERQAQREQLERQQRRQAHGRREARVANQAPILLGGRRDRSEDSAGRLKSRHAAAQARVDARLREAAERVGHEARLAMSAPGEGRVDRVVARLERAVLPFVPATSDGLDLVLDGRQRVGVVGPNGSGKSSLLKVLAGRLALLSGRCQVPVRVAWLDQYLDRLDPALPAWTQLRAANPAEAEPDLRTRLALLGLDADRIRVPCGLLSGGERLRAALACVLYAEHPPALLLLDEPGNHLDLPALEALEGMLLQYRGGLLIVSHDAALMDGLALTHRLDTAQPDWRLQPW